MQEWGRNYIYLEKHNAMINTNKIKTELITLYTQLMIENIWNIWDRELKLSQ